MKTAIFFLFFIILTWSSLSQGATPLQSLIPQKDLPEGWILVDGPQVYTKKTLFERINGQAELFFKYGFQKSVFAVYQNQKDKENQIELDIYDMGSTLHAFGIFSRFRNGDRGAGVGLESFIEDQSGIFYQGKYFIMLFGTERNPDLLRHWSLLISKNIPNPSPPPREIGLFPKEGLNPGSIQYFPEGLLGKQFLKRGFRGTYTDGEKESHLFLSNFKGPREAANALKLFQEDLSKRGKVSSEKVTAFETQALKGEDPYQGKVIVLQKGLYLLGEAGFEKEGGAVARLKKLVEKIK